MTNPYLVRRRADYDTLRQGIEAIQIRAATEGRDLTEAELTSVRSQGEQAQALAAEITDLTEIHNRHAAVASMAADLAEPTETRAVSGTTTRDRDPGHYRSETDGGRHSFFADLYRSRAQGDEDAGRRLTEHTRALSTGTNGPGVVPPRWLTDEFELLARQGRSLANAVRNIPLGDDPRPITLPKQTVGTDTVVAEQAAENNPVVGTDVWDSDVDTVTPRPTAGKQIVSRQMIDMASPAIDQLIYGDLLSVYNDQIERKVGAALITAAGAAITTFATEAAFNGTLPAVPAYDAVVDTSLAVWNARKRPADLLAMTVNRWGKFKKLKDSTGRPLIPASTAGPMNVVGVGSVAMAGQLDELGVIATDGIGSGTAYPESVLALRASDTLLFESNVTRFRFEEVVGPESVVLGIWAYSAVIVRQSGKSVKRFVVTAAS
ncbi:phage major capsid protein [Pseudonocardia hydrocarbonoxydans]|uniref:Phage capsid-like C-terminal domain-containing protein n=1 Tax=Pseudonocardia hydrocarbonoxydans TaxID=76726 RepID=A0A4Y3WQ84_9PSEU|nr:phage major capsid protein [Pseudonocardia hydrocarbonoxydans]GEC20985.1 hypothetical protein PHY01_32680 [Pseudonocardia hydrocarbonoxydans]